MKECGQICPWNELNLAYGPACSLLTTPLVDGNFPGQISFGEANVQFRECQFFGGTPETFQIYLPVTLMQPYLYFL